MEPIYKPLTKEKKEELKNRGYLEWEQPCCPKYADPDNIYCNNNINLYIDHILSTGILLGSLYGRNYCRKNFIPTFVFTANLILIPILYISSFKYKHINKDFRPLRKRPNFNEIMEHYPVTRRAWKKALIMREKEMDLIKSKVKEL